MMKEKNNSLADVSIQNSIFSFFLSKRTFKYESCFKINELEDTYDKNHCIIMLKWKPFKFTYLEDKL